MKKTSHSHGPSFYDRFSSSTPIERSLRRTALPELRNYARYSRASGWLVEREAVLGGLWMEMCGKVLPHLQRRPPTYQAIRQLSEYGHEMFNAHGMVNGSPKRRHERVGLPEDARLALWLGRHTEPRSRLRISSAAVIAFSAEVQARHTRKLRHLNGITSTVGGERLRKFRNHDLKPNKVRSIWVGRLERVTSHSWEEGHIKVRNPFMLPQELMSPPVFHRLKRDLAQDQFAPDDPFVYLEQQYGTPEAFQEQADGMALLAKWAALGFKGYLSSDRPPQIVGQQL